MIAVKIKIVRLDAYVFDKNEGTLIQVEIDTVRRWKKAHDEWKAVQNEMATADLNVITSETPPLPEPELNHWAGIPQVETAEEPPPPVAVPESGEILTFDSRSYKGSGIPNGVLSPAFKEISNEQSKQLSVSPAPSGPAADLRQQGDKRKKDGARPNPKNRSPQQEAATGPLDLE